ncbi:MAG: peptide chain release factor N(5)-glutamine methyltransferase [Bacteroidota bacterium]
MTIESAKDQLIQQLSSLYDPRESAGITNMVLEHLTGMNRTDRMIHKNQSLTDIQEQELHHITSSLLNNQPIQYILGEAWFAGIKFIVNEHTLIPRPETEELVEWIKATANPAPQSILDIGTGSGCIPITLKKEFPLWHIHAIDVSNDTLQVAKQNATLNNTSIDFICTDFLNETSWQDLPDYHIIVSNPPYIKQSEKDSMSTHVVEHEPHLALFVPDDDALIFYRKIATFGHTHLKKNGKLFFEINQLLGEQVSTLLQQMGYTTILRKDLHGNDRMIMATPVE